MVKWKYICYGGVSMRREYCEKDGFLITYSDNDVCFEDVNTAEAVLIANDGSLLINNFNGEKLEYLLEWYKKIYKSIVQFRTFDRLEDAV